MQENNSLDNRGWNKDRKFVLTLKAPITTAADDIHKYFSLFFRENKAGLRSAVDWAPDL